jgi:hypothetical protein
MPKKKLILGLIVIFDLKHKSNLEKQRLGDFELPIT